MIQENAKILKQECIAKDVYQLTLETSISSCAKPGQFVQVAVPGFYLRRPISISQIIDKGIVLVYRVVGEGTAKMSELQQDDCLDLFGPLGTGFPIEDKDVLLIGGGIGVPPLLETAKAYIQNGKKVTFVAGYNDKSQVILDEEFRKLGCDIYYATMDGSLGTKGTVLNAIEENNITTSFVEACGPLPMLKAIQEKYNDGYISLEARMACGLGACMGCVVKDTKEDALRVCKDGPVFPIGKVVL